MSSADFYVRDDDGGPYRFSETNTKKNGNRCDNETLEKDHSVQTKNAGCSDQEKAFPFIRVVLPDWSQKRKNDVFFSFQPTWRKFCDAIPEQTELW